MNNHDSDIKETKDMGVGVPEPESPTGDYNHDVENGSDQDKGIINKTAPLHKDLKGRHMQMIAIGVYLSE
jgi:amino acid permease